MQLVKENGMWYGMVGFWLGGSFLYGFYTVYIRSIRYIYGYTAYSSPDYTAVHIPTCKYGLNGALTTAGSVDGGSGAGVHVLLLLHCLYRTI
jgi:hypothetical protein